MSFTPVLPTSGVAGWMLLQRVEPTLRDTHARSPIVAREAEHFLTNIASATTAADLVTDRRLLGVALGAFGLEGEIDKRAFIRKVLESDTLDPESFANRLVDTRYSEFAKAFGYGDILGARIERPGFAAGIVNDYRERAFETAIGESDSSLRLALNARRSLAKLATEAEEAGRDGVTWFKAMGDKPLREVLEKAYALPEAFAKLDVDRQREILRDKTRELFGEASPAAFAEPDNIETLLRRYVARDEALRGFNAQTPGATALTLLQSGSMSFASLVQSRFA